MGVFLSPVGIDLGDSSLKVAQIRRKTVSVAALIAMPETGHDADDVTRLMQQSFSALGLTGKSAVVNVPGSHAFVRTATFPPMPGGELKEAINWEVKRQLPYPIEQAVYDYVSYDGGEQTEVTFAAVKKDYVNMHVAPLSDAGLNVSAVDINPLCILRALTIKGAGNVALIDIGSLQTEVHIVKNGVLRLTRTLETGSESVMRQLTGGGAGQKEAERKLKDAGPSELGAALAELGREIFRSIDYYKAHFQEPSVSETILLGGLSLNVSVSRYLGDTLNMPVRVADPFEGLGLADESMRHMAPLFTVAVGLARRKP